MLVNLQELLRDTRKNGYAVGLFNCVTLEMTRGILLAAEEMRSPVIIGPAESLLPYWGTGTDAVSALQDYAGMMLGMAKRARVPVALHFDHGFTPELVRAAVDAGYTSVMYDCSMLPFEENAARVKEMAAYAHSAGCSLEAEIGHVGSNGSAEEAVNRSVYTSAGEAARYAQLSGCDALAVAIGTAHGVYKQAPRLSYDALDAIRASTSVPLVLHGGSGLSDDAFRETVRLGISKINIFTHNNLTAARAANGCFGPGMGAFETMPHVVEAVRQQSAHLMEVFGSAGRA